MKKIEESLVVGFSKVVRKKAVSGSIRQLSVNLSKKIMLVKEHNGTALVCW